MEILQYALLGVVQGLTEFLPVSSSGHLVLLQHWLGMHAPGMTLEVALHVATTISVLIVYGRDITALVRERDWRYAGMLLICCVVTAIVFLPFKSQVEAFSDSPQAPRFVGAMLIVTGLWQILADWRLRRDASRQAALHETPSAFEAALIGLAMACAGLFRGISRSGATIGTAIQLGIDRQSAARFSFIAGVPIILGGGLLKFPEALGEVASGSLQLLPLALGFVCALLAGIVAIKLVLWMLRSARLSWFGAYAVLLGCTALLFA